MRLPRFGKSLEDPQSRRQLREQAVEEARAAYRTLPPEKAREPILRLQDQYDQAGIDRLELLFYAEAELSSDPFWLFEIVAILMRKQSLSPKEIPYLLRMAHFAPTRLDLWVRLFRERKKAGDDVNYFNDREACAVALMAYFPADGEPSWPNAQSFDEAYNLLARCIHDTMTNCVELRRLDARARDVIRVGLLLYPDRMDAKLHLARIIVQQPERNPQDVGTVMEVVLANPQELELKLWVAESLVSNPRLYSQGLAMLRQAWTEHRDNRLAFTRYVSAIKAGDELQELDEDFLADYVRVNVEDLRALEILADHYVARGLLSDEALQIYKLAATHSHKRKVYLQLMGKFYASRSEWSEVIQVFDELRQSGVLGEDMVMPLAMAYAQFDRADAEAIEIYRKAIELGTLMPSIHSVYCRTLMRQAPTAAESVAQFTHTLTVVPDCLWAQLGMIAHYLATGDAARALDSAVSILQKTPMDREAMRLAGQALAQDFSRKQLARLAGFKPFTLGQIFEDAYTINPEAGPIALGLARQRLANGVRSNDTVRLLGEVIRRNPEAIDLRIARADMMWDLKQEANAATIYRELLERWRGSGTLPRGITPEVRTHILRRLANVILLPPGPTEADAEILLDAASEPECPPEIVLGTARALVDLGLDPPTKLQLLALALRLAPGDRRLERASAESFAAKGNPRPAITLAARMMDQNDGDEEIASLLRSVLAVTKPEALTRDLVELLQEALNTCGPQPALLLAGMEVILTGRPATAEDAVLLEALSEIFPRNVRVKRWLAFALREAGQEDDAARILASLATELPEDEQVVLELAKTHARLGKHEREHLRNAEIAVRLEPDNIELQLHLAAIALSMRQIISATRRLKRIVQATPDAHPRVSNILDRYRHGGTDTPELMFLMAEMHIAAGRVEQAISMLSKLQTNYQRYYVELFSLYEALIRVAPQSPRPHIERGILYRLVGQLQDAVEDLREAHRLAPDNMDILSEFVDVLAQKISADAAVSIPDCLEAARYYMDLMDDENAFDMVERVLAVSPEHVDALLLLANLQFAAKALGKCLATLRRIKSHGAVLPLFQQLARAYADQGEHLQAAQVLTEAIELGGPARELLEQLRALHQEQAKHVQANSARQKVLSSLSNRAQGRYELREEIGSGSMGIVYKAYDRELDEIVVLKILPEHFANNEEALVRFRHEAKAARKLAHPSIVRIHDFGEDGGRKHISMEYVSGGDLRSRLQQAKRLDPQEAIQIVRDVARALVHAHSEGVLHRDIKTANILLTSSGKVKLSDFGIAALLEQSLREPDATGGSTAAGIGTPLYMSPEQFDGGTLTPASDLYSLGVMFYELIAGFPPFTKGSIAYHHQFTPPKPIGDIPQSLWQIIDRLLSKAPHDRYQRAEELLEVLDAFTGRSVPRRRELDIHDQITPSPFGGR